MRFWLKPAKGEKETEMRKTLITIAAAAAVLMPANVYAKPAETRCVVTTEPEGSVPGYRPQNKTCVDPGTGKKSMWTRGYASDPWMEVDLDFATRAYESNKKATEVSYSNCAAGLENYKTLGVWIGPPSAEDCLNFAKKVEAKGRAMIDEGLKGLMEVK
jgi:hypothetical protein